MQGGQVVRLCGTAFCVSPARPGKCLLPEHRLAAGQQAMRRALGLRVASSLTPSWRRLPGRTHRAPPTPPPCRAPRRRPRLRLAFLSASASPQVSPLTCLPWGLFGLPPIHSDPTGASGIVGSNPFSAGGIRAQQEPESGPEPGPESPVLWTQREFFPRHCVERTGAGR